MKKLIVFSLVLSVVLTMLTIPASAATLKQGSSGSDVYWLQASLHFLGFDLGKLDSLYGDLTRKAVISYQKSRGLTSDGLYGPVTQRTLRSEVARIQTMLGALSYSPGSVDCLPGVRTLEALRTYQRNKGLSVTGRMTGQTYSLLCADYEAQVNSPKENALTALKNDAVENWILPVRGDFEAITGSRVFGSSRANGRRHAGVDFVVPPETEVLAMTSGVVQAVHPFYAGTDCVEVVCDDTGAVIRYCELDVCVEVDDHVVQAQVLGHTKESTVQTCMLHLEIFANDATGALTQRSNQEYDYVTNANYQRRKDLVDPSFVLQCKPLE